MNTLTPITSSYRLASSEEVFLQFPIIDTTEIFKLEELKLDIGDKLFSQLSEEDKKFILETEGIIELGHEVNTTDIRRIFKYIKENED